MNRPAKDDKCATVITNGAEQGGAEVEVRTMIDFDYLSRKAPHLAKTIGETRDSCYRKMEWDTMSFKV